MTHEISAIERSPLLDRSIFSQMMEIATVMTTDVALPAYLQKNIGGCLRIVELSYRIGHSPFAIADSTYFIGGRMAMDGKLIAALINSHPSIEGSLNYTYEGDKTNPAEFFIIVSAFKKKETTPRTIKVSLEQGLRDSTKKNKEGKTFGPNQRWIDDPEQMMAYYGSRVWARRHAPEIIMGLYTPEELTSTNITEKNITPAQHDNENNSQEEHIALENAIANSKDMEELQNIVPLLQSYEGANVYKTNLRNLYKEKMMEIKNKLNEEENTVSSLEQESQQ